VELAKENFAKKPIWFEDSTLLQKPIERDLSMAQYTGGKVEVWVSCCTAYGKTEGCPLHVVR